MEAKVTSDDVRDAKSLFVTARKRFDQLISDYDERCRDLAQAKRLLASAEESLFLYEANQDALQHIPGGSNERERKYALAQWRDRDANYVEMRGALLRCEQDVEQLTRLVEFSRFQISAVKRDMEFIIAWLRAAGVE